MRGWEGATEMALLLPPGSHTATALGARNTVEELQTDYLQLLLAAVSSLGGRTYKPQLLTAEPEQSPLLAALDKNKDTVEDF